MSIIYTHFYPVVHLIMKILRAHCEDTYPNRSRNDALSICQSFPLCMILQRFYRDSFLTAKTAFPYLLPPPALPKVEFCRPFLNSISHQTLGEQSELPRELLKCRM